MIMKIISWNVNGIRATLKKDFVKTISKLNPDIICLQETKSPGEAVDIDLPQYEMYWNHAQKKGYSGTLILTKLKPLCVKNGLGIAKHDDEGRVITAEYENFYLVNVYVPNSKRKLERLDYRVNEWDTDFLQYLKKLEKRKPVIFCGDLNVAHTEIDLSNPSTNRRNHGFTDEERAGFDNIVQAGFMDSFRVFEKGIEHYTWWSPMNNCRQRNIGWRIDYFCVSSSFMPSVKKSTILKDVLGSDHCPILLELKK